MTCEEYLSNMKPGYIVDGGSEEHLVMHELSQRALKITMELNNKYHTKEEIIQLMSELTGQKIDESFGMFPPFYTDCGRNIHIGKNVFINAGCKFQDQGGIYIEDGVLIGHNAVLATINHMEDPEKRAGMIFQPIHIEKKVWLGANVSLASGNVLTQGFFSPERKGKKNSAVSRKRRKRKFLQVSLLKKCKVGVRRDRTYKLCILSGKLDRLKSHILPSRGMLFI